MKKTKKFFIKKLLPISGLFVAAVATPIIATSCSSNSNNNSSNNQNAIQDAIAEGLQKNDTNQYMVKTTTEDIQKTYNKLIDVSISNFKVGVDYVDYIYSRGDVPPPSSGANPTPNGTKVGFELLKTSDVYSNIVKTLNLKESYVDQICFRAYMEKDNPSKVDSFLFTVKLKNELNWNKTIAPEGNITTRHREKTMLYQDAFGNNGVFASTRPQQHRNNLCIWGLTFKDVGSANIGIGDATKPTENN